VLSVAPAALGFLAILLTGIPSSRYGDAPFPLRLGELNLSSVLDQLFQLGELLARINASGGLLQPLRACLGI
jgi:hypothetical protein